MKIVGRNSKYMEKNTNIPEKRKFDTTIGRREEIFHDKSLEQISVSRILKMQYFLVQIVSLLPDYTLKIF